MMPSSPLCQTLGQRLRALREAAGWSQRELAQRVGVRQGRYSKWERDAEGVPEEKLEALARLLGADAGRLGDLNVQVRPGRPVVPALIRRCHERSFELPDYDVKGTLEDVLHISEAARRAVGQARGRLSAGQMAHLEGYFPRDSAHELLAAVQVIALSASVQRMTLAQLRCPVLVVERRNSVRPGLYHQRDVLVLERPKSVVVMVPQPWVVSPTQSDWYRLDFLTCVTSDDRRQRWADVEVDDDRHRLEPGKDERRARGVACPRLGFPHWQVERADFGTRLLSRLEEMLDRPQPVFTYVQPGTNCTTGDPYDPWFNRSKQRPGR